MTSANVSNSTSDTAKSARTKSAAQSSDSHGDLHRKAEDAVATVGGVAKQATEEAKRSANQLASEANEKIKGLLSDQVDAGADLVNHFAGSMRTAASDLDRNAPQMA